MQRVVESVTRTLIHEGDMVELDPSDNCAVGRVRGFLLNDSFMIASWLPNKYILIAVLCFIHILKLNYSYV